MQGEVKGKDVDTNLITGVGKFLCIGNTFKAQLFCSSSGSFN